MLIFFFYLSITRIIFKKRKEKSTRQKETNTKREGINELNNWALRAIDLAMPMSFHQLGGHGGIETMGKKISLGGNFKTSINIPIPLGGFTQISEL